MRLKDYLMIKLANDVTHPMIANRGYTQLVDRINANAPGGMPSLAPYRQRILARTNYGFDLAKSLQSKIDLYNRILDNPARTEEFMRRLPPGLGQKIMQVMESGGDPQAVLKAFGGTGKFSLGDLALIGKVGGPDVRALLVNAGNFGQGPFRSPAEINAIKGNLMSKFTNIGSGLSSIATKVNRIARHL